MADTLRIANPPPGTRDRISRYEAMRLVAAKLATITEDLQVVLAEKKVHATNRHKLVEARLRAQLEGLGYDRMGRMLTLREMRAIPMVGPGVGK